MPDRRPSRCRKAKARRNSRTRRLFAPFPRLHQRRLLGKVCFFVAREAATRRPNGRSPRGRRPAPICRLFSFTRLALVLLAIEYFSLALLHSCRVYYFSARNANAASAFRVWNIAFIVVRLSSMVLSGETLNSRIDSTPTAESRLEHNCFIVLFSVLVLWYGLRSQETPFINPATGNFNSNIFRCDERHARAPRASSARESRHDALRLQAERALLSSRHAALPLLSIRALPLWPLVVAARRPRGGAKTQKLRKKQKSWCRRARASERAQRSRHASGGQKSQLKTGIALERLFILFDSPARHSTSSTAPLAFRLLLTLLRVSRRLVSSFRARVSRARLVPNRLTLAGCFARLVCCDSRRRAHYLFSFCVDERSNKIK